MPQNMINLNMAFEPGICPKCKEYVLLKSNIPFLVCPICGQSISSSESIKILEDKCSDKDSVHDIIADCIALEMQYGPELPFMILGIISENFPLMESPAYLLIKMAGYDLASIRAYLTTFAEIKSEPANVPWAEEFLDNCLSYKNMELARLFEAYIENKIRKEKKKQYLDKVTELKKQYSFKADNPNSTKWLLRLYIISSVINVLLFPCFMFISGALSEIIHMYYALNILISIVVVCSEIGFMYLHHKIYGNRLNMSDLERKWMVIFISSLIFVIGASIMGSIWKIKL